MLGALAFNGATSADVAMVVAPFAMRGPTDGGTAGSATVFEPGSGRTTAAAGGAGMVGWRGDWDRIRVQ
jgi:hypothetical protein